MPFDLLTVSALKGFVLLCTVYGLPVIAINSIASDWLLLNICWSRRVCYNRRRGRPANAVCFGNTDCHIEFSGPCRGEKACLIGTEKTAVSSK